MRTIGRRVACLLTAGLTASTLVGPAGAASDRPHYREYVALGDSWSADVFTTFPPTTEFTPFDCAQSSSDYPHQVARTLGVAQFRDATCGSATTEHMAAPQADLPLGGVNPPQLDRLSPTTDLVTLGIGGNDIGLAGAVQHCLNLVPLDAGLGLPAPLGTPCKDYFTAGGQDRLAATVDATGPKVAAVITQIRQRSPRARVLLVNYLNGLPADGKGCWPSVPITDGDIAYLQQTFLGMNAMLKATAKSGGVQLVDTYTPTVGHDVCQAPDVRYIEGLVPIGITNPLLLAFPFHPNQAGADAQARIVTQAVLR